MKTKTKLKLKLFLKRKRKLKLKITRDENHTATDHFVAVTAVGRWISGTSRRGETASSRPARSSPIHGGRRCRGRARGNNN